MVSALIPQDVTFLQYRSVSVITKDNSMNTVQNKQVLAHPGGIRFQHVGSVFWHVVPLVLLTLKANVPNKVLIKSFVKLSESVICDCVYSVLVFCSTSVHCVKCQAHSGIVYDPTYILC